MTVCGLLRLDGADVRRSELTGMLAASSIGLPAARRVHLDGSFGVVAAADDATGPMPPVLVGPSGLVIVIVDHGVGGRVVPVGRSGGGRSGPRADRMFHAARADRALPRWPGRLEQLEQPRGPEQPGGTGRRPGAGSVTVLRPPAPSRAVEPSGDGGDFGDGATEGAGPPEGGVPDRNVRVAAALMRSYRAAGHRALGTLGEHLLAIVWEPTRRRLIVSRGGRRADDLVIWSDGRYFAFGVEQAQVLAAGSTGAARPRRLAAGETLPVTVATRLRRPPAAEFSGPRS